MMDVLIATAMAQDVVLPPVPTQGVSPVVQWLMGLASSVISVAVPLVVIWAKRHFELQAEATRAGLINGAVTRAAAITTAAVAGGATQKTALDTGVDYVIASYPDAISKTPEATRDHLATAVHAESVRLAVETPRVQGGP